MKGVVGLAVLAVCVMVGTSTGNEAPATVDPDLEVLTTEDGTVVDVDALMMAPAVHEDRAWPMSWDVRASATGTSLRLAGASPLVLRADDRGRYGGALTLEHRRWTLRLGSLRFDHGLGLMALGAGRWRRVGAGAALPSSRAGVGAYTGVDPRGRMVGGSVSGWGRSWRGDVVFAGSEHQGVGAGNGPWAARLSLPRAGIATAMCGDGTVVAGSLALEGDSGAWRWASEAAGVVEEERSRFAAAGRLAWKVRHRSLETLLVAGDDLSTPLSDGLPMIGGARGYAWAVRGRTRLGENGRWSMLATGALSERERSGGWGEEARHVLESEFRWRGAGAVSWRCRVRRVLEERLGWRDAQVWDPHAREYRRSTWNLALGVTGDWLGWSLSGSVAERWRDDGTTATARRMVRLQADQSLGGGVLRLSHVVARGGALDVMTADAPAPGLLAVRHGRYLHGLWTAGWSGKLGGLWFSLSFETLERRDGATGSRTVGGRIRVRHRP